mgnify:CR=1 FL=1
MSIIKQNSYLKVLLFVLFFLSFKFSYSQCSTNVVACDLSSAPTFTFVNQSLATSSCFSFRSSRCSIIIFQSTEKMMEDRNVLRATHERDLLDKLKSMNSQLEKIQKSLYKALPVTKEPTTLPK